MRVNIIGSSIPHEQQRYETTGDWNVSAGYNNIVRFNIKSTEFGDWRYDMLNLHHELTEAALCYAEAITDTAVSAFDREFETARLTLVRVNSQDGMFLFRGRFYDRDAEPGDCDEAPYYHQHQVAEGMTRLLAERLGVSWSDYEAANRAQAKSPAQEASLAQT